MNFSQPRDIQIITIASDLGAGTQGSGEGARYLMDFFSNAKISKLSPILLSGPKKLSPCYNNAKYIEKFTPFAQNSICPALCSTCQKGQFPFILSGDHANAIGVIAGIQQANPQAKIGILWIDAHSDIHTPYTTPSGNLHGMSLAAVTRTDNLAHITDSNETPQQSALDFWHTLKFLAPEHSGISFTQLGFIGLRSFEEPEIALIKQENIPLWTVDKLRELGINKTVRQVEDYFNSVDYLIISFDVDVLDGSSFQATGTPVPQGLQLLEAQELLNQLLQIPKLIAFEITEFNPSLSPNSSHWVDELSVKVKDALAKRFPL